MACIEPDNFVVVVVCPEKKKKSDMFPHEETTNVSSLNDINRCGLKSRKAELVVGHPSPMTTPGE